MTSSTIFELLSISLGKSLEQIVVPNFVEAAVKVASEFGDEPPSRDSMQVLFEVAFKNALSNVGKKVEPKKVEPKKKAEPKTPKSPKVKRTPAPKPQWFTLNEMKEVLTGENHYCGFVAGRGPNKNKFCATVLTEEHKNCGVIGKDGWVPHTPEKELEEVGGIGHKMRCKKCWAKGKNDDEGYRKEGSLEKAYPDAFIVEEEQVEEEQVEEEQVEEEQVEEEQVEEEQVEEDDGGDDTEEQVEEEVEEEQVEEEVEEEQVDGGDDTEALLDGLLD